MSAEKGTWMVRARCVVDKVLFCEGCTEDEARENPYEFCSDETEVDQRDYEVYSVERHEP